MLLNEVWSIYPRNQYLRKPRVIQDLDTSIHRVAACEKTGSGILLHVNIIYKEQAIHEIAFDLIEVAGWSSGNTLAYHTGDPGSITGRDSSSKSVRQSISKMRPH